MKYTIVFDGVNLLLMEHDDHGSRCKGIYADTATGHLFAICERVRLEALRG